MPKVSKSRLRICKLDHGGPGNSASVFGHHGSVRICIRLYGSNVWLFDPEWEDHQ